MSRRIFLFRHGQASFGQANYDALSENGRRQTDQLAHHLLRRQINLDHVFHGSLVRQRDSARPYLESARAAGLSPRWQERPAFNEFQAEQVVRHYLPRLTLQRPELGEMLQDTGGFQRHFETLFSAVISSWQANEHPDPRIEDWATFRDRVRNGFQQVDNELASDEQAGIFTSGGVISVLLQPLMNEDEGLMARMNHRIANASITLLEEQDGAWQLRDWNNHEHLVPLDLVTFR